MRLATWNVNSLRQRMPHLLDWLDTASPDIVGLQETKVTDELFPREEFEKRGYFLAYSGQKSYNGVALLSKTPINHVECDITELIDPQRRILAATVDGVRVINLYVPNGSAVGSEKYAYKLDWLAKMAAYLRRSAETHPLMAVMGDFNIAPDDCDVHDPDLWRGQILCSDAERAAFRLLLERGFVDCFRLFAQAERSFSWWDYRQGAFRRNLGLRIDHILVSPALRGRCLACSIDLAPRRLEKPSDHAPVVLDLTGPQDVQRLETNSS